jgi:allantoinase
MFTLMTQAPSSYAYVPLPDRRPLRFPGGAQIAVIVTINIEYWEARRPGMKEPLYPGGPATIPYPLPGEVIDFVNWTWREYGQRVGIWRMMEVFDKAGVAPSCTLNAMIAVERRRIVEAVNERGWELVPHNWVQTELLSDYALEPDKERALIRRTLDEYEKAVGRPAKAWLSSSLRATLHTPAFLKEFGLIAFCDYLNDDQPYLIDTVNGPIVCVPYSNDLNDFNLFARGALATGMGLDMLKLAFDRLYREGEVTGRIMNVGLHPHVIGQPHRIGALEDFLAYVKGKPHVWFPTREEIATWYLAHHAEHIPPAGR